jgi:hypothetical protein
MRIQAEKPRKEEIERMSYYDDDDVSLVKIGLSIVGSVVVVGGFILSCVLLGWCGEANNLALHKVFDPQYEQVRRDVFEKSKAYNQGMIQELRQAQMDYLQADATQKAGMRSLIIHRFADYDEDKLPADLQEFIHNLKAGSI